MHLFELEKSRSLFCLWHIIMKLRGRSPSPLRVFEDVKTVVLTLSDEFERLLKVFVSFTRKADDDIARKSQTPAGILYAVNSFEVVTAFMSAPHQFEYAIAA